MTWCSSKVRWLTILYNSLQLCCLIKNLNFKIVVWNANGVLNYTAEIQIYIIQNNIDMLLISETHLTNTGMLLSLDITHIIQTILMVGILVVSIALLALLKSNVKYYELGKHEFSHLQATSTIIDGSSSKNFTIPALYCPPKHSIK